MLLIEASPIVSKTRFLDPPSVYSKLPAAEQRVPVGPEQRVSFPNQSTPTIPVIPYLHGLPLAPRGRDPPVHQEPTELFFQLIQCSL